MRTLQEKRKLTDLTEMIARNAENIECSVRAIESGKRAEEELPELMREQEKMIAELRNFMGVEA